MPWTEAAIVSRRKEFVDLTMQEGANITELCKRYVISPKTAYKWIGRFSPDDPDWAKDRSRRPHHQPRRVSEETEAAVLALHAAYRAWGGRKLRRLLDNQGFPDPPAPSTITAILKRNGLIRPEESAKRGPMQRFEREQPNELWQMDFKGQFTTMSGVCHPLTIIDDHSRFSLCVAACPAQREIYVREILAGVFRLYGMPVQMLMDNGSVWKSTDAPYTKLTAWLIRLGVRPSHCRPYHPQTQGKDERFNRTLKTEAIRGCHFNGLDDCQRAFDRFRHVYNHERPHDALMLDTPATHYRISPFAFPEALPPIEYLSTDIVRKVGPAGYLSYRCTRYQVGRAFSGDPVALRLTERDGVMDVYYCNHVVATIDLRNERCTQH